MAPPWAASSAAGLVEALEADTQRMARLSAMGPGELAALLGGDPLAAGPWIETAARHGVVQAQLVLAQMRLDGVGVAQDHALALQWFRHAARAGEPAAINMVGRCLENGWGEPQALAEAARWYLAAAEAGDDWGAYNYANLLFDGRGLPQDQVQAIAWYQRAAAAGHGRAMNLLARCYEEGWGVARDLAQAGEWYERSAATGYFRAQYNLAALRAGRGQIDAAFDLFEAALRGATPGSLPEMALRLAAHPDARLAALGRSFAPAAEPGDPA